MTATQSGGTSPATITREEESARPVELAKDELFHILQNQRRRYVLRYLQGRDEQVRMRDVAEQVAAWEHETTVQALTTDERQRVYISLYQCHLPKLADEGVIEYNQSRGHVVRTSLADQLDPYLDATARTETSSAPAASTATDPADATERSIESERDSPVPARADDTRWLGYYLGATGIGIALLTAVRLSPAAFAGVSDLAIGAAILGLFSILTMWQLFDRPSN
ncbi:DUF7344 domain-containing protein [Halegenticoccus tardaugens]|uniref:DUF7344 domain-containing protein n=1 Tax=Halegenticoccus tardaugens TaxID=2071624 RepID=UPI00100AECE4|nr:hypothetical protein [Halegenticoccus tardaugens]